MTTGASLSFNIRDNSSLDPDAQGQGINGDGWIAEITFSNLATGGTFDASKIAITVSDPGFDANANATTITRIIRGGKILRRQAPNEAELMIEASGSDVLIHFSLREAIYHGSTITGVSVEAGAYTGSIAGSPAAITNSSTRPYDKPLAAWLNTPHELVGGNAYAVELCAFSGEGRNGRMVACVAFEASDGTNVSTVARCATPTLSALITQGHPPECYKANVPISALTQGAECTVNAKVYPWIGDVSAVLDLAVDGYPLPTSNSLSVLPFVCNKDGTYGGAIAYVQPDWPVVISSGYFGSTFTPEGIDDDEGDYGGGTYFYHNYSAYRAFRSPPNFGGFSSTENPNSWLGVRFAASIELAEVRITAGVAPDARIPTHFFIEWSDSGTLNDWHIQYTGNTGAWATNQTRVFNVSGGGAHTHWRIRNPDGQTVVSQVAFATAAGGPNIVGSTVSTDPVAAKAQPHRHMAEAIAALAAYNNANFGHNNHGGSKIYLMDAHGSAAIHQPGDVKDARVPGVCWTDIMVDPEATGAVTINNDQHFNGARHPGMIRYRGSNLLIDTSDTQYFLMGPENANGMNAAVSFDGVEITTHNRAVFFTWRRVYLRNVTVTNSFYWTQCEIPQAYGIVGAPTYETAAVMTPICMIGCNTPFMEIYVAPAPGADRDSVDGSGWHNNTYKNSGDICSTSSLLKVGLTFKISTVRLTRITARSRCHIALMARSIPV